MFKAIDKWLPGYLKSALSRPRHGDGVQHLMFCLCDHFEPFRGGVASEEARRCVQEWTDTYPKVVEGFRDADGCSPRHTFFYPEEEYDEEILNQLAGFCRKGFGEVEIHLHHRHDTAEGLRKKLEAFRDLLHQRHGLLGVERGVQGSGFGVQEVGHRIQNPESRIQSVEHGVSSTESRTLNPDPFFVRYGFIHGNWALCNSRPDGDWCGVNEELGVLARTGCYADFTFPSVPSVTQPRMVNAIYYAADKPGKPRGADRGVRVQTTDYGRRTTGIKEGIQNPESRIQNGEMNSSGSKVYSLKSMVAYPSPLLLITGPLALNWRRRKWGVLPRIENGEISGANPPSAERARLWAQQQIGVRGRPDWVFVKLHTHGCVPENARVILGDAMRTLHETLRRGFNDGKRWQLHYVTAREAYNLVKAAEAGVIGAPGPWRDYRVGRPRVMIK